MHPLDLVTVDGATLSCAAVAAVARRGVPVAVAPTGLARAARQRGAGRAARAGLARLARHGGAVAGLRGARRLSPQAARAAAAMVPRLRTMLACELVAAVRGLRQRGVTPSGARLREVYRQCRQQLPDDDEDHPLDTDIAAAEQVVAELADERAG